MGLLSCEAMRALEDAAFRTGVCAEELMDKAGHRLGRALVRRNPAPGTAVAFIGRGNNGGDALVALQDLRAAGWEIAVRSCHDPHELGSLPRRKLRELGEVEVWRDPFGPADVRKPLLLLDGLLGIGAQGPLREPLDALALEMNGLRSCHGATVAAVDIPSGVNGDTGEVSAGAVCADCTLTIGVPKSGLVEESALDHVGRIELVSLEELPVPPDGDRLIVPAELRALLPPRAFDTHKGQAGRIGIVAGSRGMLGAALLSARGALRGGGGLVTLFVPEDLYPLLLACGPPPELMVKPVQSYREVLDVPCESLAIGPGLGQSEGKRRAELLELLSVFPDPLVVDADALNLIAAAGPAAPWRENMLVTPHPGEMARIYPEAGKFTRAETARRFVESAGCALLLKGARTIVTGPGEPLHYNSTGTPGMASGGQGDVLTGLAAALAVACPTLTDAARAAAWLAGKASELALASGGQSEESLLAGDTADKLGAAFRELREQ